MTLFPLPPDLEGPSPPDLRPSRRHLLLGLGAVPLATLLGACGGSADGADIAAADTASSIGRLSVISDATANTASGATAFVHPGLLHTDADFARMRARIAASEQPWLTAWSVLTTSGHSALGMVPNPQATVIRGGDGQNFATMVKDMQRAYQLALRWKVSQDRAYADLAVVFLDAWSGTMTTLTGNADRFLAAGIYGYQWANVVELMRDYDGWSAEGLARFQQLLLNVFYPLCHQFLTGHNGTENTYITNYWANWDLCNIAAVLAIGTCCDRRDLYDEAIAYYKKGRGNGAADHNVYMVHPGHLGQWQESGRDQGHATLGMSLCGALCEMAWNQGDDLFGYRNNRLLAAAEYVAASNLPDANGNYPALPFATYVNRQGTMTGISGAARPHYRAIWELLYNHYVNRLGLSAPYVTAMAAKLRPEGRGTGDDPGMGTLTFTRESIATGAAPSGLVAYLIDGLVQLSWWGSAYATGYEVQRATAATGPFTTLASVGEERTYTDTPGNGTWHYRVVAVTPSGRLTGTEVRSVATTPQLRLRLPLDEGSGSTANDTSGNALHSQLLGAAAWGEGRLANTAAVALDGASGYVAMPAGIMQDLADFTISVWVYRLAGASGNARVFDIGTSDITYLTVLFNGSNLTLGTTGTTWHGKENVSSSTGLATGRWVHLAATRRGTTLTLYLDGQATGSNTDVQFAPHQMGATEQNWLGRAQYAADPYFKGRLQDFRLYSGALSATDIVALAAG